MRFTASLRHLDEHSQSLDASGWLRDGRGVVHTFNVHMSHRPEKSPQGVRPRRITFACAATIAAASVLSANVSAADSRHGAEAPGGSGWAADQPNAHGMYETFAPDGTIALRRGGPDDAPRTLPFHTGDRPRTGGPVVIPVHANGPSANRIDLVFVGDGYTAAEQPKFVAATERAWQALMSYEPYKTYQNFFNAERIDIASPVSGISADPTKDVKKTTPLGMHFWCHGIDRLLCVDNKATAAYQNLVPGRNHVVALANTTTYGGAGGSITTLAGENDSADQVIVHEMSHTVGQLGDEYDVPYETASGDAGTLPNVSENTASTMTADKTKWANWIGTPSADGSTVGAFEGANYYKHGFYRPSANSNMRQLGIPFNPPSIEALIKAFYTSPIDHGKMDSIDSATPDPAKNGVTNRDTTLSIKTVPLVNSTYEIYWALNGTTIPTSIGSTNLNLATTTLPKGKWNQVSVYVRDTNPAVRDEAFRTAEMTKARNWWVWGG